MLGGIGTWEILVIFLVLLLLFGAKRIPEIARGLGKGVTEFKNAVRDVKEEIETADTPSISAPPTDSPSSATQSKVETGEKSS
jgi:sec-independent protein translocase protein TatA